MITIALFIYILSNAVLIKRDSSLLFGRLCLKILLSLSLICYTNLFINSLNKDITLFNSLFNLNANTLYFQIFVFVISLFIINLNGFIPQKFWIKDFFWWKRDESFYYKQRMVFLEFINNDESYYKVEYCLIILFILTGASYLITTSDLVSIILSIELQSYGLYLLAALYRDSEWSTTAALTYFLLGSLSSCFILLGSSLLYINSCITSFDNLYVITHLTPTVMKNSWYYSSNYIGISLLIISVGLLFKVSAAPFHFWSPDVYDMIPTLVTTFVAIIAKISLFTFFLEIIFYTNNESFFFNWLDGLLFSCICSLIIGTVLGLTQVRIKKIYAYSTISHIGFILLSLSIYSLESIKSFIFYLTTYSLSNLNGFLILLALGFYLSIYNKKQENNKHNDISNDNDNDNDNQKQREEYNLSPIQSVNQIIGYFYLNPLLSLSLAITLFSFIGIPPLIGFFAKQMVLSAALNKSYIFISVIAIITSVIGAVYYLNIINKVFFSSPEYDLKTKINLSNFSNYLLENENKPFDVKNITLSSCLTFPISLITLIIIGFIFMSDQFEFIAIIGGSIKFNL